jgi:hypothetical protein
MSPFIRSIALLAALGGAACTSDRSITVDEGQASAASHGRASHLHATPASAEQNRQLAELRRATAPFHDFEAADAAGYGERITPCWEHSTLGAMGYHYGDPSLIDGTVELLRPELLMYEPGPGGQLRLVGMEYIVPIDAWEGDGPPTLLGEEFHPHSSLPIYKLHVWLWRNNPAGTFADWNPAVSCAHADDTETFE